jgi:hypothetical protein
MRSRDIFEALAAITHPLPEYQEFAALNDHLADDDRQVAFSDTLEQAEREREAYLNELREQGEYAAENGGEFDPLLGEVARCRAEMLNAERRMRLLVAYAREFVRPQPYQLKDLAQAAGLSISGVRIAYDEDEVREVIERTGDKPRRPWPDPTQ